MNNLIDLHSHILPHIDDGAKNLNQSIQMARACVRDGIRTIVATPHYYESKSRGYLTKRLEEANRLRLALHEQSIPLEIMLGCEVNATHTLLKRRSFGALTLAGTKWILLERPYVYEDEFDTVIEEAFEQGLRPLIAHPERYPYFTVDFTVIESLVGKGAWVQLTASAVIGAKGKYEQVWCLRAIEYGMAHIVASDMHNIRSRGSHMSSAARLIKDRFGEEKMQEIMHLNPARILGRRL